MFDVDPLNVILNSFSKIDRVGEGAALQILVRPQGEYYVKRYKESIRRIEKGIDVKVAIDLPESFAGELWHIAKDILVGSSVPKKKEGEEPPKIDEELVKEIRRKVARPIVSANIRIVASAGDRARAEAILSDIESAFNQFETTEGARLSFLRQRGRKLSELLESFSLRTFGIGDTLPLNISEVTTLLHFPGSRVTSAPALKRTTSRSAPAPVGLPTHGVLLGMNTYRGLGTRAFLTEEDRLRHLYLVGQTGTGKSTLLKNMLAQDIRAGEGVCFIDPHGVDIEEVLSYVPLERLEDVIYFDPSYTARPMALNMLEYDSRFPEQKTFVVNEMLSIFNKLFDMKTAGGPMFEQYFRNSVMLTIEDPASGATLLDVSRVLSNKTFRDLKLARCKNPIVVQFWREVAEKAGGEAALQNIVPYITSKFDTFLTNDIMRPVIAQERSSFNFRELMDARKILLVNLAKGRLGDLSAHLLGLILVGKILMAALSRVDSFGKEVPPFYLYLDEFQNITTDSIATILSEARKYKLSLTVAHQFIKQLDEKIKDAVFGNVGSIAAFRVGAEDAEHLAKQFAPVFSADDLINLPNRHAYVKLLANGRPAKPFDIETLPPPAGSGVELERVKELSYLKYGRAREEVEAEIMKKYEK